MSKHSNTAGTGDPGRRSRDRQPAEAAARPGGHEVAAPELPGWPDGKRGKHAAPARGDQYPRGDQYRGDRVRPDAAAAASVAPQDAAGHAQGAAAVARRTATGWRVGDEEVSDLTSAMVLADLLAAELPTQAMPTLPAAVGGLGSEPPDPRKLEQTVAQLEHALTARVRVEQAIGVLAERHRLRPRQAFELLRSVARAQGRRVLEMATEVVESATNPLLRIPEELAKPPMARRRGRRLGPDAG